MFKELPNTFGIVDDILVVGYYKYITDSDTVLQTTTNMQKTYKFQWHEHPILGNTISRHSVQPDSCKLHTLTEMPAPQ